MCRKSDQLVMFVGLFMPLHCKITQMKTGFLQQQQKKSQTSDEPKSYRLKMRKCVLTSQVQVSLRG